MHSTYRQILLLVTAMAISAVIILLSAAKGLARQRSSVMEQKAAHSAPMDAGYLIGECNGRLALFRGQSPKPYRILQMQVYLLPEEDQRTIRSGGIPVATEEELRKLLEDWDS
jgi:hypothetical protein